MTVCGTPSLFLYLYASLRDIWYHGTCVCTTGHDPHHEIDQHASCHFASTRQLDAGVIRMLQAEQRHLLVTAVCLAVR